MKSAINNNWTDFFISLLPVILLIVVSQNSYSQNLSIEAAKKQNIAVINAQSVNNFTPHLFTAMKRNTQIAATLLANGAHVNSTAADGIADNTVGLQDSALLAVEKWLYLGGEFNDRDQTQEVMAGHLERLGADLTLGKNLGRYYERGAREKTAEQNGAKD